MGIANDYTPNVDDLTAPTVAHAAFRMADEVRFLKQRFKYVNDYVKTLDASVAAAEAAQLAAQAAQLASELAQSGAMSSALAAAASASAAAASEVASEASEVASEASEQLARAWANNPYNVEVIPGTGLYSALHYATDALNIISGGFIDDSEVSTQKAYSSAKVLQLYNAQAEAIKNLSGASASISSSSTPVFADIPSTSTKMFFSVVSDSTDTAVFTLNDAYNTIKFIKNGSYNFLSMVQFSVTSGSPKVVRFQLVDTSTNAVLVTQDVTIEIAAHDTTTLPLNTLIVIDTAPKNIKIMVTLVSGSGISLDSFYSILASAGGSGSGGATGGGADEVFYLNGQTVTADFTIPVGQNAMSAGPVTVANGVTVTVSNGSNWVVV